jgi:Na+/proline symporter
MQIMNFDIDLIIFIVFLTITLVVGIYYGRKVNTLEEYSLGGRKFSTGTLVSTIVATWIGGGFFSIAISQTYQDGIWFIAAGSGDIIAMVIIGYIIAPRMARFLGSLSVAETMGNLYGKNIRIVTSISSIFLAVGAISMQIKVLSSIFNYFFHFTSIYAVLFSSALIMLYSAFGGIRSVTMTDVLQFLTFGTVIPTFALFTWDSLHDNSTLELLLSNPLFDYHTLSHYYDPNFFPYLSLFIYSTIPALDPAIYQRLLIAKNTQQIRQSFLIAAIVGLCIFLISCFLGAIMFLHNDTLNPNNLLMYILDNYSYTGLKGLILIGVTAMIMSTADSYINVASVTFVHDLCKPLGLVKSSNDLFLPRVMAFLIGILAVVMALFKTNILELLLLIGNFYAPVIMIPLIMAILGFRTTTKIVFLAITAGITTVIIWRFTLQDLTNVDSVLPGTLANFLVLITSHFFCDAEHGVGVGGVSPL